jgi:hypothetical protein
MTCALSIKASSRRDRVALWLIDGTILARTGGTASPRSGVAAAIVTRELFCQVICWIDTSPDREDAVPPSPRHLLLGDEPIVITGVADLLEELLPFVDMHVGEGS